MRRHLSKSQKAMYLVKTGLIPSSDGVAIKLRKGQQLLLNLHLFNLTDAPLTGTSGTEIITMPESEVVHEAEVERHAPHDHS